MAFGSTLATRNTAGSGRNAWETRHCEPLGAALLAGCPGFQTTGEDRGRGVYKAPAIPLCWSVLALLLSSCVTLGFLFRNLPILFCTRVT